MSNEFLAELTVTIAAPVLDQASADEIVAMVARDLPKYGGVRSVHVHSVEQVPECPECAVEEPAGLLRSEQMIANAHLN